MSNFKVSGVSTSDVQTPRMNINGRLLFSLIFIMGAWARLWHFNEVPPGLNQDEASIGLEAYYLLRFGVDRNGISFPVNFVSWGNGMDSLYGYVLMTFVAFGLTPLTVRLPSLLAGLLTLPLLFFVARRTIGYGFGLIAMMCLAISPWHIMLSRWGINENILPLVFLAGYASLLKSRPHNRWFIVACIFFGLSLYVYAATYVAVPIFLAGSVVVLLRARRVSARNLLLGLFVFGVLALPLFLFVAVNTFRLQTIHLGFITIPRLPVEARFESMSSNFSSHPLQGMAHNLGAMMGLLWSQSDGLIWNTFDSYGYFYSWTFPLAIIGAVLLFFRCKAGSAPESCFLLIWLAAAASIGLVQEVNINRLNLIFIPLLLSVAYTLTSADRLFKGAGALLTVIFLIGFAAFSYEYHGPKYQEQAKREFFDGLVPALDFARKAGDNPICVTDHANMPYIFALFSDPMSPAEYLPTIEYSNPSAVFRPVRKLGRYTFGVDNCSRDPRTVFVVENETPPRLSISYSAHRFSRYQVLIPQSWPKYSGKDQGSG